MRKSGSRGFRGQLKLDITRLQRRKDKLERRVTKMIQELTLIDNLIKAMEIARNPETAPTPAVEAAQVAEGTQESTLKIVEEIAKTEPKKEDPNAQAQG